MDKTIGELQMIGDRLDLFELGAIDLNTLITDISNLLHEIDDPRIVRSLRDDWAVLEEVYSVAQVDNGGILNPARQAMVSETTSRLRRRVGEFITRLS